MPECSAPSHPNFTATCRPRQEYKPGPSITATGLGFVSLQGVLMNYGGREGDGQKEKIVGDAHNSGRSQNRAKRHLYLDLNRPAQQELEAPASPVPVVSTVSTPRPVEEFPGDKLIDWASGSIGIGPDGKLKVTYSKPKPMTKAERIESEKRLALKSAVYEAQERDEAYYQGRLDKLSTKRGLPMEDNTLDTSFVEDPWVPSLW